MKAHTDPFGILAATDWETPLVERLDSEYRRELREFVVECSHDADVRPAGELIFAALRATKLADTRIVLVGQDPYPTAGHATGIAFAVPRTVQRLPPTLRNIYAELDCDMCLGIPAHGDLSPWTSEGVFLLNAALTTKKGEEAFHRKMWKPFTDCVIRVADKQKPVYILWGRHAQAKALPLMDRSARIVIRSPHPSPLSAHKGFFGSKPFSRANQGLVELSGVGIDWRLDP